MNKKVIVAGLSVVAFGAVHATFWSYQSGKIKESIGQLTTQVAKGFGGKDAEFIYSNSSVSGYPLSFKVTINEPKYTSLNDGKKVEISSGEQPLVIVSNLTGSSYKIKVPVKIDIKKTISEKEKAYTLEFNKESPSLEVRFAGNVTTGANDASEIIQYLGDKIKSLHYSDSGYIVSNAEDGSRLALADLNEIRALRTIGKDGSVTYKYNIKTENMDNSVLFASEDKPVEIANSQIKFWPVNTNFEFSSVDMRDSTGKSTSVSFNLKDINVSSPSFGVGLSGDIQANGEDIFPFGDVSIKINGYQNLVDYFGGIVNQALADSKIPLFHISAGKDINFKKVLLDVASEKSNEDKDITIKLQREQGKNLFVGQKGLMEVVDMLKSSSEAGEEVKKEGASILPSQQKAPQQPVAVDVAPAAGGAPAPSASEAAPKVN